MTTDESVTMININTKEVLRFHNHLLTCSFCGKDVKQALYSYKSYSRNKCICMDCIKAAKEACKK